MKITAIIFIIFISFSSCCLLRNRVFVQFDYATFNQNRAAWQSLNISNYSYSIAYPEFINDLKRYTNIVSQSTLTYSTDPQFARTIDDIYSYIEYIYISLSNQIIWDNEPRHVKAILVDYDSTFRFIKSANYVKHQGIEPTKDSDCIIWMESFSTN